MNDGHFVHVLLVRFVCLFVLAVQTSTFPLHGMDQRLVWLGGVERSPKRPRQPPMPTQTLNAHQVRSGSRTHFWKIGLGDLTRKDQDRPPMITQTLELCLHNVTLKVTNHEQNF